MTSTDVSLLANDGCRLARTRILMSWRTSVGGWDLRDRDAVRNFRLERNVLKSRSIVPLADAVPDLYWRSARQGNVCFEEAGTYGVRD
jgi:hypothetical protein